VILDQTLPAGIARVPHNSGLPELPPQKINLYRSGAMQSEVSGTMAALLRDNYARLGQPTRIAAE
jgi:hypothetical protein